MLALFLLLQTAVAMPDTATYTTTALRQLVTEASRLNQRVPAELGRYRVSIESEVSIGLRDGVSTREVTTSVEQMASDLTWRRTGEFEQHVTGYRSQSVGPQFAILGFFRDAWAVPSLYGNRLALLFGRDTAYGRRRAAEGDSSATRWAIHPLAEDREKVYRFAGGDTVEALQLADRVIRIVRVDVTPRAELTAGTVVFTGEVDLDAARKHVVRMRGSFAQVQRPATSGFGSFVRGPARIEAIAFVELVNSEIDGAFWLPQYQRFEAQAVVPVLGDGKAIFRIVSTFGRYDVAPSVPSQREPLDTLQIHRHFLTLAARDSLSAFQHWRTDLGDASSRVTAEDFTDVAPSRWRPTGTPVLEIQTEALSDLARFNRVEGLFTGEGVKLRFRDVMPGLTARAMAGYAWSERTVRGRIVTELERGTWRYAFRAGRSLDPTNDFINSLDSAASLGAVIGQDDHDYVDRRFAGVSVTKSLGADEAFVRIEGGWAQDRDAPARLVRAPFGGGSFLPDRGTTAGDYVRTGLAAEWHPNVDAAFLQTGTGGSIHYVRGDGQLRFQRVEGRLTSRRNVEAWTFALRFDVGATFGDVPPQQLFEVGRELSLPGYDYKAFAGNQAAVLRGVVMYRLGWLQAPMQVYRQYWLPAPGPSLTLGLLSGWTGVSSDVAWRAMRRLVPGAVATGDARVSVAVGLRFFGGTVGFDVARPIDHAAPWTVRLAVGPSF